MPKHIVTEIMRFFEDYKVLEGKTVEVGARMSRDDVLQKLRESAARYRAEVGRLKAEFA